MEDKNPVQSAGRIFSVLELLAKRGPLGVSEIGRILDLNKSTVHRLLASLISMGYAKKEADQEKYYLSYKIVALAESVLKQSDMVTLVHPLLRQLSDLSKETVHMVQRDGNEIVYIDKVESDANSIRMVSRIGLALPIFTTGVGKAILAYLPETEVQKLWNQTKIQALTPNTITTYEAMKEELEQIRQRGYALDNEENELGVRCIAASIQDYRGTISYAFSISAPVSRMTDERIEQLAKMMLEFKKRISDECGGNELNR